MFKIYLEFHFNILHSIYIYIYVYDNNNKKYSPNKVYVFKKKKSTKLSILQTSIEI